MNKISFLSLPALVVVLGFASRNYTSESVPTQAQIRACQELVAWIIARESYQIAQVWWVPIEVLGIIEGVQVQRGPKGVHAIKAVRRTDWKVYVVSVWNEGSTPIDPDINISAQIALGPLELSASESLPNLSITIPTCAYKKWIYSVDSSSNSHGDRLRKLTSGI
jgi:hypothetical protein